MTDGTETGEGGTTETPEPEITLQDLIENQFSEIQKFVRENVRPSVAVDKMVLAEVWAVNAEESDKTLEQFEFVYVYKIDDVLRGIEGATATLSNAVSVAAIAENNVNTANFTLDIETLSISTFDAEENNSDIEMADFTNYTVVYSKDYQKESFESEIDPIDPNPPVVDDKIESIQDLIDNYSSEVYNALNENFLESAGKAIFGSRNFRDENIVSSSWDIGNSNQISEIKFITTYAKSNTSYTYGIATISLNKTINVQDLSKDNIASVIDNSTATFAQGYTFNYNPTIQSERAELTNAICDKVFKTDKQQVTARYIVDNGGGIDGYSFPKIGEWGISKAGMSHRFSVVEITERDIKQVYVNICHDQNKKITDELYIQNIKNNYYNYSVDKIYELSGVRIEKNEYTFPSEDSGWKETVNTATNSEIISALEKNCSDKIYKTLLKNQIINKSNISNVKWYAVKNKNGNVTSAECAFYYKNSSLRSVFYVARVSFLTPLTNEDIQDILNGETKDAIYSCAYNTEMFELSTDHISVVNALVNKLNENWRNGYAQYFLGRWDGTSYALRDQNGEYIKNETDNLIFVDGAQFFALLIGEKDIGYYYEVIKLSSSDREYIANLNAGNCDRRKNVSVKFTFSGEKL